MVNQNQFPQNQKITFMQHVADHAENKKLISRILTFIIFGVALFEEFYFKTGVRDNWMELTKWCLLYYFSRSAVEKAAKYVSESNKRTQ